jgi:perosamine synthetase
VTVFQRYLAPAGAPIGPTDLARWAGRLLTDSSAVKTLCDTVANRVGVRHCLATSTGRAALTVLLRSLKRGERHRDEVIIPAYTCYSVAAAVVRAGLRPRIVDISDRTLDFEWRRLEAADTRNVLAIIATNLYGMPSNMPRLLAFARQRELVLIDDAAQAFGATVEGRACGTWGDAGIYSFDKGKNVAAIEGGLIVTNDDCLGQTAAAAVHWLPGPHSADIVSMLVKLGVYSTLLRPSLYWIPNAIPQLGLGQTVYDTSYDLETYNRPLAALALTMLRRLDEFTAVRRANAAWLRTELAQLPRITLVEPTPGSEPVYLRFPILAEQPAIRDSLVHALNAAGIGATASYPRSVAEIADLAACAGDCTDAAVGQSVATRIVTLPTHPFVRRSDLQRMANVIRCIVTSRPVAAARSVQTVAVH